jgi:hypothetical protein
VDGWDTQDLEGIVERRRMRGGSRRRRSMLSPPVIGGGIVALLLVVGVVTYLLWPSHNAGIAGLPDQALTSPGYSARIGANDTVTIALRVRNTTSLTVKIVSATFSAPAGLTRTGLTIVPAGKENEGFDLNGALPPSQQVQLGTTPDNRDAVVAARYTVNCKQLQASTEITDESITIRVEVDGQQRDEEITAPAVGDQQWLDASAERVCTSPPPTSNTGDQPLSPDAGGHATP